MGDRGRDIMTRWSRTARCACATIADRTDTEIRRLFLIVLVVGRSTIAYRLLIISIEAQSRAKGHLHHYHITTLSENSGPPSKLQSPLQIAIRMVKTLPELLYFSISAFTEGCYFLRNFTISCAVRINVLKVVYNTIFQSCGYIELSV